MDDRAAMRRAIALAWGGWGRVAANPLVGAIVRREGVVVAEAHHAAYGAPHAEALALEAAGELARGADLIVTLEPCAHHGKTPPCVTAITAAGIRRVVFGARDPNPLAAGGAAVLERAGVVVESGVLDDEVRAQNALFFHRHAAHERPFVALKLGLTLDARIADSGRNSRWVTGPEARGWVHWLRAGYEAIAVGAGTAAHDDPDLTVRGDVVPAEPPKRVVFDDHAALPATLGLLRTARLIPVIVFTGPRPDRLKLAQYEAHGADVVPVEDLATALRLLKAAGVASVLVEGGGVLAGRLLAAGLVDRLYLVQAPLLLGPGAVPAFPGLPDVALDTAPRWRVVERRALDQDTLLVADRT